MAQPGDASLAVCPGLTAPLEPVPEPEVSRKDLDDFAALDELQFISVQGRDRCGSTIISIVGKDIPAQAVPGDVLRRYVLFVAAQLVREAPEGTSFSVVYFHSAFEWDRNCPGLLWLQGLWSELCATLTPRLRITGVYAVHPSLTLRAGFLALSPWLADSLYSKIIFISRVEFLDEYVDISREIDVPGFVCEHDATLEQHPLMDYGFHLDPVVSKCQIPDIAADLGRDDVSSAR